MAYQSLARPSPVLAERVRTPVVPLANVNPDLVASLRAEIRARDEQILKLRGQIKGSNDALAICARQLREERAFSSELLRDRDEKAERINKQGNQIIALKGELQGLRSEGRIFVSEGLGADICELLDAIVCVSGKGADALMKSRGSDRVVVARHIAFWLARERLGLSYPEIGRMFNRDHTSAWYGVQVCEIVATGLGLDPKGENVHAIVTALWEADWKPARSTHHKNRYRRGKF